MYNYKTAKTNTAILAILNIAMKIWQDNGLARQTSDQQEDIDPEFARLYSLYGSDLFTLSWLKPTKSVFWWMLFLADFFAFLFYKHHCKFGSQFFSWREPTKSVFWSPERNNKNSPNQTHTRRRWLRRAICPTIRPLLTYSGLILVILCPPNPIWGGLLLTPIFAFSLLRTYCNFGGQGGKGEREWCL